MILLSILTIYPWVLIAGLIGFLSLIARFYEIKYAELYKGVPGQQTRYLLFSIPLVLFLVAAARYTLNRDFAGSVLADIALFLGGVLLAALAYRLQQLMTGGSR
jgi:uncharacterized membrane protein